ncbi:DUF6318 family protein [Arthrobacter sp. R4-81]
MPEAAKAETKEGLEAFAKYWYALMNYAYETGNLEPIKSLAAPASSCAICDKIFPAVEKWNSEGRWVEGQASKSMHYKRSLRRRLQESIKLLFSPNSVQGHFAMRIQPLVKPSRKRACWVTCSLLGLSAANG